MPLIPEDDTRALDPTTGEPYYWRGWYDGARNRGLTFMLRRTGEGPYTFEGRIRGQLVGRETPPFKAFPRYCDLYAFQTGTGTWVVQRRWVSEAKGETPCAYSVVVGQTIEEMRELLLEFDPTALATHLWDEDQPGAQRRNLRVQDWLRTSYTERVNALLAMLS